MVKMGKLERFGVVAFVILAFTTSAPITLVFAQLSPGLVRSVFAPANDVSLTLSLEKDRFSVGEKVSVNYRITNISNHSLYVPRGWETTACLNHGGPHILGDFENSAGEHRGGGYGSSCGRTPGAPQPTLTERMTKGTVLLHPGDHFDGILELFAVGMTSGPSRVEVTLRGWKGDEFTETELVELKAMGNPFLSGEVPASAQITLIP